MAVIYWFKTINKHSVKLKEFEHDWSMHGFIHIALYVDVIAIVKWNVKYWRVKRINLRVVIILSIEGMINLKGGWVVSSWNANHISRREATKWRAVKEGGSTHFKNIYIDTDIDMGMKDETSDIRHMLLSVANGYPYNAYAWRPHSLSHSKLFFHIFLPIITIEWYSNYSIFRHMVTTNVFSITLFSYISCEIFLFSI